MGIINYVSVAVVVVFAVVVGGGVDCSGGSVIVLVVVFTAGLAGTVRPQHPIAGR